MFYLHKLLLLGNFVFINQMEGPHHIKIFNTVNFEMVKCTFNHLRAKWNSCPVLAGALSKISDFFLLSNFLLLLDVSTMHRCLKNTYAMLAMGSYRQYGTVFFFSWVEVEPYLCHEVYNDLKSKCVCNLNFQVTFWWDQSDLQTGFQGKALTWTLQS